MQELENAGASKTISVRARVAALQHGGTATKCTHLRVRLAAGLTQQARDQTPGNGRERGGPDAHPGQKTQGGSTDGRERPKGQGTFDVRARAKGQGSGTIALNTS